MLTAQALFFLLLPLMLCCGIIRPLEKENKGTSSCKQQQLGSRQQRKNSRKESRKKNPPIFVVDSIVN